MNNFPVWGVIYYDAMGRNGDIVQAHRQEMPMNTIRPNPNRLSGGTAGGRAEYSQIVSSLNRIRSRLWVTRMLERVALGLGWAGVIAVFLVCARLLVERYMTGAFVIAAIPLAAAGWMYFKTEGVRGAVVTPNLLRLAALTTGLVAIVWIVLLAVGQTQAYPIWGISATCGGIFAVVAGATVRMVNTRTAAIFVDQQVGLRERVSTALEVMQVQAGSELEARFQKPIVDSALAACAVVRTAKVGYARLDRRAYALAICAILAASGVSLLNPIPALAKPNRPVVVKVQTQNEKLKAAIAQLEKKQIAKGNEDPMKNLDPLKTAMQKMSQENMNTDQATAAINEAREAMDKSLKEMGASEKVEATLEASKELDKLAAAANELAAAEESSKSGAAGAAESKTSSQQKLQSEAKALGDKLASGKMSEAEKKQLADDLKKAAEKAKDDPQLQSSLNKAAEKAKSGDAKGLQSNMQDAAERMAQQKAVNKLSGEALKEGMAMADEAMDGLSANEREARERREEQQKAEGPPPPGLRQCQKKVWFQI